MSNPDNRDILETDAGALPGQDRHNREMKSPRSVYLEITRRCNLRCAYCSYYSSAGDVDSDLPTQEWLRFFVELGASSVMSVVLSGGEPFVRSDIRQLVDGIRDNRMRFSVLSNGILVTDELASLISRSRRCDGVQISIDGPSPDMHDALRGPGSFELAIQGIKRLQGYHVPVSVRVTVHRQNVRFLETTAQFLFEEIGIRTISTNSASYLGMCRSNAEHVQLRPEERTIAMEQLLRVRSKYPGRLVAAAGPLAEALSWQAMEHARTMGRGSSPVGGYLSGCGCSNVALAVRADGVIVPCSLLGHIELGRINQDSVEEVWQHNPSLARLRQRSNLSLASFEFCSGCPYLSHCSGNCPGISYSIVGEVDHPSPDACLRKFLRDGGQLPGREAYEMSADAQ